MNKYILDEDNNPVKINSVFEWATWIERAICSGRTLLCKDDVAEFHVSTIFLGVEHCSNAVSEHGHDFLFETMVFGPKEQLEHLLSLTREDCTSIFSKIGLSIDFQRRYRTKEEAYAGHDEIVKLVQKLVAMRN